MSWLLVSLFNDAAAQKVFRSIKSQLKAGQAQEALNAVGKLQQDSTYNTEPRLYDFGTQAYIALNDALNEKVYLKQTFDTLQFFQTIYGIYDYALRCDSLESVIKATRGKSPKFRKQNHERILKYYKNLNAGGRYFYAHGKYADAIRFLKLAQELPHMPVTADCLDVKQDRSIENAVMLVRSAFEMKDTLLVQEYAPLAMQGAAEVRCDVIEVLARMAEGANDVPAYLKFLRQGLDEFPDETFFFTSLSDYYTQHEDYRTSLALADDMLRVDSVNYYFLLAKGLALINLDRSAEAVIWLQRALAVSDSTNGNLFYYIGAAYCNLAASVELPVNMRSKAYAEAKKEEKHYYVSARDYMERFRDLCPDEKERWAPLLYKIYLNLNEGDKFDEIEQIVSKL